jgi:hypothetical protein
LTEVPKVTSGKAFLRKSGMLLPPSCGADQAIGNHAEPEVYDEANVELKGTVARKRKGRREEEVGDVSQDDGAESLEQID